MHFIIDIFFIICSVFFLWGLGTSIYDWIKANFIKLPKITLPSIPAIPEAYELPDYEQMKTPHIKRLGLFILTHGEVSHETFTFQDTKCNYQKYTYTYGSKFVLKFVSKFDTTENLPGSVLLTMTLLGKEGDDPSISWLNSEFSSKEWHESSYLRECILRRFHQQLDQYVNTLEDSLEKYANTLATFVK